MTKKKYPKYIMDLLKKHNDGIRLDIGAGFNKQPGFVGLDMRDVKGIDIVHNAEIVPYPLPADSCHTLMASHLIEHLCPKNMINIFNEWWRILKVGGQAWVTCPYGKSFGYMQDPTHCNMLNEATMFYFDPTHQSGLWEIYRPLPWKIERNSWFENGNMEIILSKREQKKEWK